MQEITSLQNPIIKETTALHQKKNRAESGMFLIEGIKGVEEALRCGLEIKYVFMFPSVIAKGTHFFDYISKKKGEGFSPDAAICSINYPEEKIYFVDEKILKKISTTETPPEIVAVAYQKKFVLEDLFKEKNPLIIVLENIKDAGNLGTIIRTAKAANVSGIVLTGECIDIYNPKVVRSSAANLWKIPVVYFKETALIRKEIEKYGQFQFLATKVCDFSYCHPEHSEGSVPILYHEINYNQPTVVFFGSEAEGISDLLANQADEFVKIPMSEEVESLNLSISAGIVMYEVFKQRL
ncbi:MAG TPA: hypothetical protein DDW90_07415 [Cyanobacteria bacterium UBA9971]|nr:hypothetical protein [Cyanobacteria bacterium UBA9971]